MIRSAVTQSPGGYSGYVSSGLLLNLPKQWGELFVERTGKIYPSPCPHCCPENLSEARDGLRVAWDVRCFYSANICGSTMGSIETFFQGGIQGTNCSSFKHSSSQEKVHMQPCEVYPCWTCFQWTQKHRTVNVWMEKASLSILVFSAWLCLGSCIRAASLRFQRESVYIGSPHCEEWNLPLT